MTSPHDRLPPPFPPPLPRSPAPSLPPYAMPVGPLIDPRPASVRALGIIGMIFGGFALLTPLTAAVQALTPSNTGVTIYSPGRAPTTLPVAFNPAAEMYARPMLPWTIASHTIAFALGIWLLWAAIQAFKLRERGRRAMLAYAVAMIVFALVAGTVNATFVMPRLFAGLAAPRGPLPAGAVNAFAIAIGIVGGLVGTIYPTFVLIFFRRPHIVAAFASRAAETRKSPGLSPPP